MGGGSVIPLTRPLVFLDTETTGPWPEYDRIVQVAMLTIHPDGTRTPWSTLVKPPRLIPPEATAIHGITNDAVAHAPSWALVGMQVTNRLADADVAGKNVKFDLKIITAECEYERMGWAFEGRILDTHRLRQILEPRSLSDDYLYYTGRPLEGAHDAMTDVLATAEILEAQIVALDAQLPDVRLTVDVLHAMQWYRSDGSLDPEGKIKYRDGHARWAFGKNLGKPIASDPGYCRWILREGTFSREVNELARKVITGEPIGPPDGAGLGQPLAADPTSLLQAPDGAGDDVAVAGGHLGTELGGGGAFDATQIGEDGAVPI